MTNHDAGATRQPLPTVGFVGLGTMGGPMARNVLAAGYSLTVWNRTASRMDELVSRGAQAGADAADVAARSQITITMVSGPADVEQVITGPRGVAESLSAGCVVIDMSTIDPATSRRVAEAVRDRGADFLDAPVSGSRQPAESGTLAIMVGGRRDTYERCRALLGVMGSLVIHAGEAGQGSAMKLVVNLVLAHMIATLSEATVLAQKIGLSVPALLEVLALGGLKSPWYQSKGKRILSGDFSTNFALKHMFKDVRLVLAVARDAGVPLDVAAVIERLFAQAAEAGASELDYSAVIQVLERAAGVAVRTRAAS